MSEYRIAKRRHARATITLATGAEVSGSFYLAEATAEHAGGERVFDLMNRSERFFPFEVETKDGKSTYVALYARAQVLQVKLAEPSIEVEADVSLEFASRKTVSMLLVNGSRLRGELHVATPDGMDRLSDFASRPERFQYFGARDQLSLVNFDHVVEILPVSE